MQLHADAKYWYRLWSMRWIIATTAFSSVAVAYVALPADWLPEIPQWVKQFCAIGTMVSAMGAGIARVLKQPDSSEK